MALTQEAFGHTCMRSRRYENSTAFIGHLYPQAAHHLDLARVYTSRISTGSYRHFSFESNENRQYDSPRIRMRQLGP